MRENDESPAASADCTCPACRTMDAADMLAKRAMLQWAVAMSDPHTTLVAYPDVSEVAGVGLYVELVDRFDAVEVVLARTYA